MSTLTVKKDFKKSSKSASHALFNRQCKRIDMLRNQLKDLIEEYEQALSFYHSELQPKKEKTGKLISTFLLKLKEITQSPNALNKKERASLQKMMEEDLNLVFNLLHHRDIEEPIKEIYQEVFGVDTVTEFKNAMQIFRNDDLEIAKFFDIDELHPDDDVESLLKKFMHSAQAAMEKNGETSLPPKEKSKAELLKEEKARELENLQCRSLNNIYKRLVKELHPDLEQDPEMRLRKESLMKQLTTSYEEKDLMALLKLEADWMVELGKDVEKLDESSLKIYNSILKDQIKDLENEIIDTGLHPRYFEILDCIQENQKDPLEEMRERLFECEKLQMEYTKRLDDLNGDHALKTLRSALQSFAREPSLEDALAFLSSLNDIEAQKESTSKRKR